MKEKEIQILKQQLGGLDPWTPQLPVHSFNITPYILV